MFDKYKKFFKDSDNQKKYARWIIKQTRPYIPRLLLLTALNSISVIISIVVAVVSKRIIDNATDGRDVKSALLIYAVLMLGSISVGAFFSLISTVITEKYSFEIRRDIFRGVLDTCWSEISNYHSGDVMTRLTSDINIVASGVSNLITSIIVLTVQLFVAFFTLYYFDHWLAVFTLVIAPITAVIGIWLGKKMRVLQVKVQETEAAYRSFLQESVANQIIIKSFCNQQYSEDRFMKLRNDRLFWILKKNRMNVIATTTMNFAYSFVYVVAFGWGAIKLSLREIRYGTLSVFLSLVGKIQDPLVSLSSQIPQIITVLASAGRIVEINELERDEYRENVLDTEKIDIDIRHLTFGYVANQKVIDDASINIKSGEFVAIIGESGVGKTTLIRLIMNFLSADSGEIAFIDKNGNEELVNAGIREYMSYVPQGNTLFSGTIADNIRMGKNDATDEEISLALKAACADIFVDELEDGMQTKLGEKGHGVSEGQAQRIAIARALIRKVPLLILDEATSSLDEKTELKVLGEISRLNPRPTCILITHRRSVLEICTRELIIEEGKIKSRLINK